MPVTRAMSRRIQDSSTSSNDTTCTTTSLAFQPMPPPPTKNADGTAKRKGRKPTPATTVAAASSKKPKTRRDAHFAKAATTTTAQKSPTPEVLAPPPKVQTPTLTLQRLTAEQTAAFLKPPTPINSEEPPPPAVTLTPPPPAADTEPSSPDPEPMQMPMLPFSTGINIPLSESLNVEQFSFDENSEEEKEKEMDFKKICEERELKRNMRRLGQQLVAGDEPFLLKTEALFQDGLKFIEECSSEFTRDFEEAKKNRQMCLQNPANIPETPILKTLMTPARKNKYVPEVNQQQTQIEPEPEPTQPTPTNVTFTIPLPSKQSIQEEEMPEPTQPTPTNVTFTIPLSSKGLSPMQSIHEEEIEKAELPEEEEEEDDKPHENKPAVDLPNGTFVISTPSKPKNISLNNNDNNEAIALTMDGNETIDILDATMDEENMQPPKLLQQQKAATAESPDGTFTMLNKSKDFTPEQYNITVYEEFDEENKHRENKKIPDWASNKELLKRELYMLGPPYHKLINELVVKRDPVFPVERPNFKLFPPIIAPVPHVVRK